MLYGAPGTGRYTTALHTLTHMRTQGVKTIRQIRREPNDRIEIEGLKDEDTGWILDLRYQEETLRQGFGAHLLEAAEHLRATQSYVVVVTDTETWMPVADEATDLACLLTPPPATDVLHAHLQAHQSPVQDIGRWHADATIIEHLRGATPSAAADLARVIISALDLNGTAAEPKDFTKLVEAVMHSTRNWRGELRKWHTENPESSHRTYLLAAATLDGAPADIVQQAHGTLSQALRDSSPDTRGQHGPGIIELTHAAGAEFGDNDRIHFRDPGYAEAVVDYFWIDRPHHIAAFTRWTAEQAATLSTDLSVPLAERVTRWAARYTATKQSFTVLRAITTQWASTPKLRSQATDLLVAAALDPATGKRARDQYLAWAKAPDAQDLTRGGGSPIVLKQALAAAMAQLGPVYPRISLRRLTELATNTKHQGVADAVGEALTHLWRLHDHQHIIRDTLSNWFKFNESHYTAAARRAFLHLAGHTTDDGIPWLLSGIVTENDPFVLAGWRCALDDEPSRHLQHAVSAWLDSALPHEALRHRVLWTLSEAVFRSETDRTYLAPRFIKLNHAAYAWEPSQVGAQPTARTELRDSLVMALRNADPTAPATLHVPTTS